ncbi:MAG: DUF1588 domain-containing protein [Myxococcota bacterium]|nr:DUF1588 domain-containing protein [Myxococcota bacterium]
MTPLLLLLTGCKTTDPGEAPVRRLTPTQYNNTISDLLGYSEADWSRLSEETDAEAVWPWPFPADIEVHGFEGNAEGQIASAALVEQYQAAASHFAGFVPDAPEFWTCEPDSGGETEQLACAQQSIIRFTTRAWRRPLQAAEQDRVHALLETSIQEWGVSDGITLTAQGVLMAPQFLYRVEGLDDEGDAAASSLSDFELASRMSYFIYNSMPDPELFEAAASGDLSKKKGVTEQAARMLSEDRSRASVVHFHSQWLGIDDVYTANADMDTYQPIYLPEAADLIDPDEELFVEDIEEIWSSYLIGVRVGMVLEAELFVERTIFDGGGTLRWLMTDNHGYVTTIGSDASEDMGTDRIYGTTSADVLGGEDIEVLLEDGNLEYALTLQPVAYPADQRAGVLTQPAVLTALSHPVHPAPILRGVFIKERMLCETVGQPPDGAEASAPSDSLDVESTNRERTESATASPECVGCHQSINPLGFALENFDSLGGWRDTDNGYDVDASGTLDITGAHFSSPVELAAHLADSTQLHDCYTLQWTRYALGQSDPDPTILANLQDDFLASEGDIQQLIIDITASDAFRYRSGGAL